MSSSALEPLTVHPSKIRIIVSSAGAETEIEDRKLKNKVSSTMTSSMTLPKETSRGGHQSSSLNKKKLLPVIPSGNSERNSRGRTPLGGCARIRTRSPSPLISSHQSRLESTTRKACSGQTGANHELPSLSLPSSPRGSGTLSRFHQGCIPNEEFRPFLATRNRGSSCSTLKGLPVSNTSSSSSSLSIPSVYPGSAGASKSKPMDPEKVEHFLNENPAFLESYVRQHVDADTLQKWVVERDQGAAIRRQSLSRWKFGIETEKFNLFKTLASQVRRSHSESGVLWELSVCISSAVSANSFVLYLLDGETNTLRRFSQTEKVSSNAFPMDGSMLATYVCRVREPIRLTRPEALARFSNGLGDGKSDLSETSYFILCHPIVKSDGEIVGVLEIYRDRTETQFYKEDEEIVHSYLVWGGIALHYADLNSVMNKQKKLNEFLLGVVRSIFQDMISMDAVIKKVMNFAQRLVDADRASLFLVDSRTKELYARIFDMGNEQEQRESDAVMDGSVKEIRFSMGTGIAGIVATSGQILNITDAYKDDRFNRGVDQVTGYVTKSILCMPVFIRSTIIGVVQMVNKRRGPFTKDDEDAFEMFAVYCGLALHHAKLYDKIRRSEQKYRVALEVLSYHNSCSDDEFQKARAIGVPKSIPGLDDFYFKPNSVDALQKVHYSVYQFVELFGLARFDIDSIYRFTLTVKKNYRAVPYHNWTHGFTVAHCMFCILQKSTTFRPLECLALYVGCLCHDLDHRGMNNKFMLESASPLATIYSTSTMEHHHFNQTVTILQQEGHNIFAKLSSEEYKQVLGNIKHCILATDLALFFSNKARLAQLLETDAFSWGVLEHRLVAQAVAMTASDLCASAKPWDIQMETVKVIFEEFYYQGDLEKKAGRKPIAMMDRDCADELPASQVGFISGICIPCYEILEKLIPTTTPLLAGCQINIARWRQLDEEQKKKRGSAPAVLPAKTQEK